MSAFPIVDTHVHFWDPANLPYPWLKGNALLERSYLPADYTAAVAPCEIERIVFVEAACSIDRAQAEVAWVTTLAQQDVRIQAITASAPLEQGDAVLPVLEALARNPLVRGIRRTPPAFTGDDENATFTPDFVTGVRHLKRVDFHFEICVPHTRLPAAIKLVRGCPDLRFILDHIGCPDIKSRQLDPWRDHVRTLAGFPNVFCKMSGVATAADCTAWTREDLEPAITHILDCFGFERTAFGSDWPVMLAATTYPRWVDTLAWAVRNCSQAEKRRLFRDTAIEFYRLA